MPKRPVPLESSRITGSQVTNNTSQITADAISPSLAENHRRINKAFGGSSDLVLRVIQSGSRPPVSVLLAHIDGLTCEDLLSSGIIRPITLFSQQNSQDQDPSSFFERLKGQLVAINELIEVDSMGQVLNEICAGACAIMVEGHTKALVAGIRKWMQRNPDNPETEPTIRGAKEGFTETYRTNTALIRRRIMSPRLHIEDIPLGNLTRTTVGIAYIQGVAKDNLVEEVRSRIQRINTDAIEESGVIEEYIEDNTWSPFPTLLRTERPDRVTDALLQGRVAIITAGSPFVLIAPATFMMFLQSPDDYFERYPIGTLLRLLRVVMFLISLLLPAIYVAAVTYHQEMIPTPLVLAIAAQREGIPFPAVIEALILEISFEILREASLRVPRMFGPTVSIVGVLFLGQVAVQAGLVSPFMVIVVALTGITSLGAAVYSMAISVRILRFFLLILGGTLGLAGVIWGLSAIIIHLVALRSFGVPYMEPFGPIIDQEMKDAVFRAPWWALNRRPLFIAGRRKQSQVSGQMPSPPPSPPAGRIPPGGGSA